MHSRGPNTKCQICRNILYRVRRILFLLGSQKPVMVCQTTVDVISKVTVRVGINMLSITFFLNFAAILSNCLNYFQFPLHYIVFTFLSPSPTY